MSDTKLNRTVSYCLLGMVVSLLLVGLVSGTPIRHVIQVTPACVIAAAVWRGLTWSRAAALPILPVSYTHLTLPTN